VQFNDIAHIVSILLTLPEAQHLVRWLVGNGSPPKGVEELPPVVKARLAIIRAKARVRE
jgi:hypothetical protein